VTGAYAVRTTSLPSAIARTSPLMRSPLRITTRSARTALAAHVSRQAKKIALMGEREARQLRSGALSPP